MSDVGNLDNDTWGWWNATASNGVVYPTFTHRIDEKPTITYSIDSDKFISFSDMYHSKGVNLVGFKEYYENGISQNTSSVIINEENAKRMNFTVATNDIASKNINVYTAIESPVVYKNGVAVPSTTKVGGVEFLGTDSGYTIESSSLLPVPVLPVANFSAKRQKVMLHSLFSLATCQKMQLL